MELVNPVPVDDVRDWLAALAGTLLGDPHDDDFPRRVDRWSRRWRPERTWACRDAGRIVATLATEPRSLTVPGPAGANCDLEADALTAVTVAATHRRRGVLTSMITRSLQAAKDRGDPLSMLIAAEWPIYGRFGYAPAVLDAEYTFHSRRAGAGLAPPPPGSVRQVDAEHLGDTARSMFDAARRLRPGQVDRRDAWWDRELGLDGYAVIGKRPNWIVHEGPDGPDGLLAWRPTRDFELVGPMGQVTVDHFFATNDTAYRDLWGYLAGIDVVDEIKLSDRPVDEAIRWLLPDGRALEQTSTFDYLWLRLLDVPAALAARSYSAPGRVVLDVVDEAPGGYGAGRFVLDADESGATCVPTPEPADLRIDQRALASGYLGGVRLGSLLTGVEELTGGALARADLMFSVPSAPWNQTGF